MYLHTYICPSVSLFYFFPAALLQFYLQVIPHLCDFSLSITPADRLHNSERQKSTQIGSELDIMWLHTERFLEYFMYKVLKKFRVSLKSFTEIHRLQLVIVNTFHTELC